MIRQGSGVILAFGGDGPQTLPAMGGFKVSLDAVEGLRRQRATELGPHGIPVVTLRTAGIAETVPEDFDRRDEILVRMEEARLLKHAPTLADVGEVATLVASDRARTLTGTFVNISGGALMD